MLPFVVMARVHSDLFLIDDFDIVDYMNDAIIAGLPQYRGHITYMWNGIMFFNMPKMEDLDIDFSDGVVNGELTDVGGNTYYYFKKNNFWINFFVYFFVFV